MEKKTAPPFRTVPWPADSAIHESNSPTLSPTAMMDQVAEEFRRMQDAFNVLVTGLNWSSQQQPPQQSQGRQHDEETPISRPEMPGGFMPVQQERQSGADANADATNTTMGDNEGTLLSRKVNKALSVLFISLLLIIMIPLYIIIRIFVHILFFVLSILVKIQSHGYKSIRNNDPVNISRRFIMRFDERIGNKSKNLLVADNEELSGNTVSNDNSVHMADACAEAADADASNVIDESHLVEIERPDFLECAYSHALYIVKKDIRWLLVYIESDQNREAVDFTHDVLINKKFLKFIKDRKILVWGGDISESEAFQTCNQFNITKIPFLGLFCLTVNQIPTSSGMQQSAPVLSLVAKIQGYKSLNATLNKLDRAYKKYNPTVNQLKLNSSSLHGAVRNLQGEAYANSLRRSQHQRQERQQNQEALRSQWLKWRKSTLVPECNERGEYSRIAIKLPDSSRVQIKVKKTCSLEEIYALVECTFLQQVEIDDSVVYEQPANYRHEYKFDIYSLVPRQMLPRDTTSVISENPLVYPNGNLIVEPRS